MRGRRRRTGGVGLTAALLAAALGTTGGPAGAASDGPGTGPPALVGGSASGRGVFVTYSDKETVIDGGTVGPPDATLALAEADVDLTGRGNALAAAAYSPYADAAGVINAFGGTDLPFGHFSERSRANVSGSPPQEAQAPMPGQRAASRARARITDGPRAEADTVAADGASIGLSVSVGESQAVVDTGGGPADTAATVSLRHVTVGDDLVIETVRLTVRAVADGAGGIASATSVVEGVTLAGRPVRLTPRGLEPVGPVPAGGAPPAVGLEVVATGSERAHPGGDQSDATATGPRLRLSSPDGRILDMVIGQATASSTRLPIHDRGGPVAAGRAADLALPGPRARGRPSASIS